MFKYACPKMYSLAIVLGSLYAAALTSTATAQEKVMPLWDEQTPLKQSNIVSADIKQGSASTGVSINDIGKNPFGGEPDGLKSSEYRRADALYKDAQLKNTSGGEAFQKGSSQLIVPDTCSFVPVNTAKASFTPVRFCDADPLRLTDVSNNRVAVGYYVRPSDGRYFSFRLETLPDGGYRNARVLSNGMFDQPGLPAGTIALGVSGDGQVIVGTGYLPVSGGTSRERAIRWQSQTATPALLSKNTCASTAECQFSSASDADRSEARATNSNGTVVVGSYAISATNLSSFRARRWVLNSAGTQLSSQQIPSPVDSSAGGYGTCAGGTIAGAPADYGNCMSYGYGVNGDGNQLVGHYFHAVGGTSAANRPSLGYLWNVTLNRISVLPRLTVPTVFSWEPGDSGTGLNATQLTELAALAIRPRQKVYAISPDGWSVVGKDTNGAVKRTGFPGLAEGLPSETLLYVSGFTGPVGQQTEEGMRWRPESYQSTQGVMARMGDIVDTDSGLSQNFARSIYNDTSNGGCRVVGKSYAGGFQGFDDSVRYETAAIRPAINCTGQACLTSHDLKSQVNGLMASDNKNIDFNNPSNFKWHLTEASAVSADGKTIVGSAICHRQGTDPFPNPVVGFIVEIKE